MMEVSGYQKNWILFLYFFPLTDTVMLNWCKPLVEQCRGSSLCTAPANLSTFFEREVEHVRDFDKRASEFEAKQAQQALQKVLLLGLAETRVGLYSKFHDAAVYECGYGSKQAIHLAYMLVCFFSLNISLIFNLGLPLAWMQARLDLESSYLTLIKIGSSGGSRSLGMHGNWSRQRLPRTTLKSPSLNVKEAHNSS
jgi:hypothetical protein